MRTARSIVGAILCGLAAGLAGPAQAGTDLELLGDRFRVSAAWRTADGATGAATAVPLTDETGLFWFFSSGNVELVVKVLDACAPPFHRFWFYAAGLTDVEVELTVEDTWTRQVKTYLRPRGTLFAPLADTSTFNGCNAQPPAPACGQGTREEIEATPRMEADAEELALVLGKGVTADPDIYARLFDDLTLIRTQWAHPFRPLFMPPWYSFYLWVVLEPEAHEAAKAGTFTEWDCLNAWYRGRVEVSNNGPTALITFEGRFHPVRLGADYAALPGVVSAEPVLINHPNDPGGVGNHICAAIDGVAYDYFIFWGPTRYYRVPYAGAVPVEVGVVTGSSQPRPDWWPRLEQCMAGLDHGASH